MDLPIDRIPGTNPPKFHWRNVVQGPNGPMSQRCEGALHPSVEVAVSSLILLAKQLIIDNAQLREANKSLELHIEAQEAALAQNAKINTDTEFVQPNPEPQRPKTIGRKEKR